MRCPRVRGHISNQNLQIASQHITPKCNLIQEQKCTSEVPRRPFCLLEYQSCKGARLFECDCDPRLKTRFVFLTERARVCPKRLVPWTCYQRIVKWTSQKKHSDKSNRQSRFAPNNGNIHRKPGHGPCNKETKQPNQATKDITQRRTRFL